MIIVEFPQIKPGASMEQEFLAACFALASRVHGAQSYEYKAGPLPYMIHPALVAHNFATQYGSHCTYEIALCFLHDVIEDAAPNDATPRAAAWARNRVHSSLLEIGVKFLVSGSEMDIADDVVSLSRGVGHDELYRDYLSRLCQNPRVIRVKTADVMTNLSAIRGSWGQRGKRSLEIRYLRASNTLCGARSRYRYE